MESHFSQGFEMSLWSWSGSNRNHMLVGQGESYLETEEPISLA